MHLLVATNARIVTPCRMISTRGLTRGDSMQMRARESPTLPLCSPTWLFRCRVMLSWARIRLTRSRCRRLALSSPVKVAELSLSPRSHKKWSLTQ
jgi:hypothetical protein